MKKLTLFFGAIFLQLIVSAQILQSPDKQLQLTFELKDSIPYYDLTYKNIPVVKQSKLGLTLLNTASFLNGFVIKDTKQSSFKENWRPVMGELKTIVNNYNQLTVTISQPKTGRDIRVTFRLFNDGLGFRYEFPQQKN